jgi:hypothetical protein
MILLTDIFWRILAGNPFDTIVSNTGKSVFAYCKWHLAWKYVGTNPELQNRTSGGGVISSRVKITASLSIQLDMNSTSFLQFQ